MDMIVDRTCCFSGHRSMESADVERVKRRLEEEIEAAIDDGIDTFANGGALGFDTLAALAVLEAREKHPEIKLVLVLPCVDQAKNWPEKNKRIYENIKKRADEVIYTSDTYFPGCMHVRDRKLAETGVRCICYLKEQKSGTGYTGSHAEENGCKIINLA